MRSETPTQPCFEENPALNNTGDCCSCTSQLPTFGSSRTSPRLTKHFYLFNQFVEQGSFGRALQAYGTCGRTERADLLALRHRDCVHIFACTIQLIHTLIQANCFFYTSHHIALMILLETSNIATCFLQTTQVQSIFILTTLKHKC